MQAHAFRRAGIFGLSAAAFAVLLGGGALYGRIGEETSDAAYGETGAIETWDWDGSTEEMTPLPEDVTTPEDPWAYPEEAGTAEAEPGPVTEPEPESAPDAEPWMEPEPAPAETGPWEDGSWQSDATDPPSPEDAAPALQEDAPREDLAPAAPQESTGEAITDPAPLPLEDAAAEAEEDASADPSLLRSTGMQVPSAATPAAGQILWQASCGTEETFTGLGFCGEMLQSARIRMQECMRSLQERCGEGNWFKLLETPRLIRLHDYGQLCAYGVEALAPPRYHAMCVKGPDRPQESPPPAAESDPSADPQQPPSPPDRTGQPPSGLPSPDAMGVEDPSAPSSGEMLPEDGNGPAAEGYPQAALPESEPPVSDDATTPEPPAEDAPAAEPANDWGLFTTAYPEMIEEALPPSVPEDDTPAPEPSGSEEEPLQEPSGGDAEVLGESLEQETPQEPAAEATEPDFPETEPYVAQPTVLAAQAASPATPGPLPPPGTCAADVSASPCSTAEESATVFLNLCLMQARTRCEGAGGAYYQGPGSLQSEYQGGSGWVPYAPDCRYKAGPIGTECRPVTMTMHSESGSCPGEATALTCWRARTFAGEQIRACAQAAYDGCREKGGDYTTNSSFVDSSSWVSCTSVATLTWSCINIRGAPTCGKRNGTCGGTCGGPGLACVPDGNGCACKPGAASSSAGIQPMTSVNGTAVVENSIIPPPPPPPPANTCGSSSAPLCGGTCPAGQGCMHYDSRCQCVDSRSLCTNAAPLCGEGAICPMTNDGRPQVCRVGLSGCICTQ